MIQLQLQLKLKQKQLIFPSKSSLNVDYPFKKLMPMAMALPPSSSKFHPLSFKSSAKSKNPSLICRMNGKSGDMISQLELGKPEERRKPEKRVNGIFWILLINIGIYVADHVFQELKFQKHPDVMFVSWRTILLYLFGSIVFYQYYILNVGQKRDTANVIANLCSHEVRWMKGLYLYHNRPAWFQFITATFCHFSWNHLSSNLFFLYIFGKLVEEEEGNFALWLSYILTGAGANLVSWLVLPRNAVSIGASGAVFGLFAISVLVKMSWDWRKILEVLILGQFVVEKVMEAAQASTSLGGNFRGVYAVQNVNHIAHLSGALIGVVLIWLLSTVPSSPTEK